MLAGRHLVGTLVLCGACQGGDEPTQAIASAAVVGSARAQGCDLRAELVPESPTYRLGAHVWVTYRLTTSCDGTLEVMKVARRGSISSRPDGYTVSARDEKGARPRALEEPATEDFGAAVGWPKLTSFEERLDVTQWLALDHPGRYELRVSRIYEVRQSGGELEHVTLNASAPITLTD